MRKFVLASTIALLTVYTAPGCVLAFDRPPPPPDVQVSDSPCTSHYTATVFDVIAGTLSLSAGYARFRLANDTGKFGNIFYIPAFIGAMGALVHYASAGSNSVAACQRFKARARSETTDGADRLQRP